MLIINYISTIYFKDCHLTLLEKKYNDFSLMELTKNTHVYYNESIQYSSTVACTLVIVGLVLTLIKIIVLMYFPTIVSKF